MSQIKLAVLSGIASFSCRILYNIKEYTIDSNGILVEHFYLLILSVIFLLITILSLSILALKLIIKN